MNSLTGFGVISLLVGVISIFAGLHKKRVSIKVVNNDSVYVELTHVGKIKVEKLDCQGYGDKLYCNDGSVHHSDGSVTYEAVSMRVVSSK
jgi:uncharacterized protein (AIM24 family)